MYLQNFLHRHGISLIILSIFWIIIWLLFIDASRFSDKSLTKERINPYVLCTEGTTIVSDSDNTSTTLEVQDTKWLTTWQRIRTNKSSTATVFWVDGSISRLGEETEIVVNELKTSTNGMTKVDMSLNSWKSWTNTSRILDKDSSFILRYESGERVAAVRGTVFDVNLDDWYIFTEAHAIEIANEKGEIIANVPQGTGLTIPKSRNEKEKPITVREAKNWIQQNSQLDTILGVERAKKLQEAIRNLNKDTLLEQIQNWLRDVFWLQEKIPPYAVTLTNSGVKIDINSEKLNKADRENLEQIYIRLTGLQSEVETVDSKQRLQEIIIGYVPVDTQAKYNEWFARSELYDSWQLAKEFQQTKSNQTGELLRKVRANLNSYAEEEEIREKIDQLEKALPPGVKDILGKSGSWVAGASSWVIDAVGKSINSTTNTILNTGKESVEVISGWIQNLLGK